MSECPCSESSPYKEPPRLLENEQGGNVFWGSAKSRLEEAKAFAVSHSRAERVTIPGRCICSKFSGT